MLGKILGVLIKARLYLSSDYQGVFWLFKGPFDPTLH
jgi:hypothetical protein